MLYFLKKFQIASFFLKFSIILYIESYFTLNQNNNKLYNATYSIEDIVYASIKKGRGW